MKKLLLALFLALALAIASPIFAQGSPNLFTVSVSAAAAKKPAKPKASYGAGTYDKAISVKLTAKSGVQIRFTTDGTAPTAKSKLYKSPIKISKNTTLKYAAFKDGKRSSVVTKKYKISASSPVFSVEAGTYNSAQTITITAQSGAKIYYTTDGTAPTSSSKRYTSAITVSKSTQIKAVAYVNGFAKSKASSASYSIIKGLSYEQKAGYLSLDANQKKLYARLYNAFVNFETAVDTSDLNLDSALASRVFFVVRNENSDIPITTGSFTRYMQNDIVTSLGGFEYYSTPQSFKTESVAVAAAADKIIAEIPPNADHYQVIKTVHDRIILSTEYSLTEDYVRLPYGALYDGYALCEGYARAFQYVMHRLGYQCLIVSGEAGELHAWNMILLDGEWYHIDLTFDDPTGADENNISYNYFLVTDEKILQDHTISPYYAERFNSGSFNSIKIPQANGTKYSYIAYNNIIVHDNADSAIAELKLKIKEAMAAKTEKVVVYTKSGVSSDVINKFVNKQDIFTYTDSLGLGNLDSIYYSKGSLEPTAVTVYLVYE